MWPRHGQSLHADLYTFNSAISACAKAALWRRAFQIIEEQHVQGMSSAQARRFMTICLQPMVPFDILQHWKRNTHHILHRFAATLEICKEYQRILTLGVHFDMTSREQLVDNDCSGCEDMRLARVAASVVSCNSAITACDRAGQWERALDLLSSMPRPDKGQNGKHAKDDKGALQKCTEYHRAISYRQFLRCLTTSIRSTVRMSA